MSPGNPEYILNPCPPAALLKISTPFIASVVNIALTPLESAWASFSLVKTFLILASSKTSLAISVIFVDPKVNA